MLATQIILAPARQPYDIEYLIVAGGGSSKTSYVGAGGGGGGLLTNFGGTAIVPDLGVELTCSIGAGGVSATGSGSTEGGNSVLSGTGISTVTSFGGGVGGSTNSAGYIATDGGSGGGASPLETTNPGYGTYPGSAGGGIYDAPRQGYDGGIGHDGLVSHTSSGGGGGAGQVGGTADTNTTNGSHTRGGHGGNGLVNAITGGDVTYAGGGAGATDYAPGTQALGGTGGGGDGYAGNGSTTATDGEDGLGGGGGASNHLVSPNPDGGSGVIILRMEDAKYSGIVTGAPTVTTNASGSGYTTIKFLGTGTYTA